MKLHDTFCFIICHTYTKINKYNLYAMQGYYPLRVAKTKTLYYAYQ